MNKQLNVPQEELYRLQEEISVEKWLASERAGYDLCGTREYCACCDKREQYPCAKANIRYQMSKQALEDTHSVKTALRRSFKSKLIQNENAQQYYNEIKNSLLSYADVTSRISQQFETFRHGKQCVARINIAGKTLVLYLALTTAQFADGKYRVEDVSDKKSYADTPLKVRITSNRQLKYALELIELNAAQLQLQCAESKNVDYSMPYRTDEQLIAEGLIKTYTVKTRKK